MKLDDILNGLPIVPEDADALVAEGIAAMERGDEIDQEEVFACWEAKYR